MRANVAEIKNSLNQMPSKLDALTARVNEAEKRMSELEHGLVEEKAKIETWLKKIQSQEYRLPEITDSMKHTNVHSSAYPRGGEKQRSRRDI